MHDQLEFVRLKELVDSRAVADVQLGVLESLRRFLQPVQIPQGVARGAKKDAAHVVVHADDIVSLRVEVSHGLGPAYPAAACHQYFHARIPVKKHAIKSLLRTAPPAAIVAIRANLVPPPLTLSRHSLN